MAMAVWFTSRACWPCKMAACKRSWLFILSLPEMVLQLWWDWWKKHQSQAYNYIYPGTPGRSAIDFECWGVAYRTQKRSWMIAEWPPNDRRRSPLMAERKHRRRSVVAHALLDCRPCIAGRRGFAQRKHRGRWLEAQRTHWSSADRHKNTPKLLYWSFKGGTRVAESVTQKQDCATIERPGHF